MKKILAIDLGGTTAKVGLINSRDKKASKHLVIETKKEDVIKHLWEGLRQIDESEYDAIGFAVPGMVDEKNGVVIVSGNLNWRDFHVTKEMKKYTNKPVYLLNDANAVALGEVWIGSGSKFSDVLFYTIGTGIGGAIICNNKLITGYRGTAGEFGHGGVFQNTIDCNCGLLRCLEPIASATGLIKGLLELKNPRRLQDLTNESLINDLEVRKVFIKHWDILANHMSTLIYALNPEAIVIGGGVSNIGYEISKILYALVKDKVAPNILHDLKIVNASLGNKAGIYGAAKYCLDQLDNKE